MNNLLSIIFAALLIYSLYSAFDSVFSKIQDGNKCRIELKTALQHRGVIMKNNKQITYAFRFIKNDGSEHYGFDTHKNAKNILKVQPDLRIINRIIMDVKADTDGPEPMGNKS